MKVGLLNVRSWNMGKLGEISKGNGKVRNIFTSNRGNFRGNINEVSNEYRMLRNGREKFSRNKEDDNIKVK